MSAIMSYNGRKIAKMLHNAAKKFDWDVPVQNHVHTTKILKSRNYAACL